MIVSGKEFKRAMSLLRRLAKSGKRAEPNRSQILVTVSGAGLELQAEDDDTTCNVLIPQSDKALIEPSSGAVPYGDLKVVSGEIGRGDLVVDGGGGLRLKTGNRSFTLKAVARRTRFSWPKKRDTPETANFHVDKLREALRFVSPAVSTDITRNYLTGACFDDGNIVGCNGHMMSVESDVYAGWPGRTVIRCHAILADALDMSAGDRVKGRRWERQALAEFKISTSGGSQITIRHKGIHGDQYPDPAAVTRKVANAVHVELGAADLVAAAKTASKIIRTSHPAGCLSLSLKDGNFTVATLANTDGEQGNFTEFVSMLGEADGEFEVGLQPQYLEIALSGADGSVQLFATQDLDPLRVEIGRNRFSVIMPMRLG